MTEGKDANNSGPKGGELSVPDILRVLFEYAGIQSKSVTLLHWKITDDEIVPQAIQTLDDIHSFCGDGNYHISINKALILGIQTEPVEIPEINIEVTLADSKWSEPRIYTDFESCSLESATPEALTERLKRIQGIIIGILRLINLLWEVAEKLGELFS